MTTDRASRLLLFFYLVLIAYLLINTGIVSDDFIPISRLKNTSFIETLLPKSIFYFIETPVQYFTHYIWYHFFSLDSQVILNLFKSLYMCLSFYMISRFFGIFIKSRALAYFASFLFIFFPSHDATVYSFMLQYLTLSFAFYLYAFYLAHNNKLLLAFTMALVGSGISYGSTAIALALFVLFALYKQFKKGFVLLIPNIIYAAYYLYIAKIMHIGTDKTMDSFSVLHLMKGLALQILTFIDATIGPSMWLKIYYAFPQLSLISICIGVLFVIIFYNTCAKNRESYDKKLFISLSILTLLSFGMFATTGHYPQIAFNLGNRVTIFGSLLLTYLIALMPFSYKLRTAIFALIIFSVLGISDHWKSWNLQQEKVIENIRNNQDLKNYADDGTIYVSGNQYSKYGPISHIEFMSEGWVPGSIFNILFNGNIKADTINGRHRYENGYLVDTKHNFKKEADSYIMVYDSEKNKLSRLDVEKINAYTNSLPISLRHWIQLKGNLCFPRRIK